MALTSEQASAMGKLSAERRKSRPSRFPALDSPANAKLRLEYISNRLMLDQLTPSQAQAQERLHREWRETFFAELDLKRMKALEQQVRELEAQLAQARALRRSA